MAEEYTQLPVEYDETRKCWKVKLKDRELDCTSESDANVISNYPCLYKRLVETSSPYDHYLIQRLQQTVEIIKNYQINCWASRKLLAIYKKIPQKRD